MANPERGEVVLDGLTLKLSINALCKAEEASGVRIPPMLLAAELEGGLGFTDVRLLVWAGGLHVNPDWTQDDAAAFIETNGFSAAALAVRILIQRTFPPPSAEGKAKGKRPPAKTAKVTVGGAGTG